MDFTLREWRLEDAADIARVLNNTKLTDNLRDGIPIPYTKADGEEYIRQMLSAPPGSAIARAIVVQGKAVGSIAVFRMQNIHSRTAELGYYLDEAYWGRGIMSGAVARLCAEAFAATDLLRIFAEPFAENKASCRVLEKAGFSFEGTLRKNAVKNGRVLDMQMYALVRD